MINIFYSKSKCSNWICSSHQYAFYRINRFPIIDKSNHNQFSYCEYYQSGMKIYKSEINWIFCCCWRLKSATGAFSRGDIALQSNRWFALATQELKQHLPIQLQLCHILGAHDSKLKLQIAILRFGLHIYLQNHINHQNVLPQEQVEKKFQIQPYYLHFIQNQFHQIKFILLMETMII
ncbi:unnamed protein product [Paramecium sonneborni]|uniref:Uncharacterized protein n=1 Tax=Paramecium sonneborni TaxID=65129 RepID=A0A8S1RTI9_9CILI|nr:unnamed protein product [Paramecium sonneborni]